MQERRTEELAQTKVQSEHRLPISITGMALFNAFWNTGSAGDTQSPLTAAQPPSTGNIGASLRQSIIGLRFDGPEIFGGGRVSGTLDMDLFGGSSATLNNLLRLRVATIQVDWKRTSVMVGKDKPLIAPRDPTTFAQVAFSPLTGSGNLWLWQPQARFEQRFSLGARTGLRTQFSLFQTSEALPSQANDYFVLTSNARPGSEGRIELWHDFGGERRIEIAPGFHVSDSHVTGYTVPSRIVNIDWLIRPSRLIDFTGAFFRGQNVSILGSLRQGISFHRDDPVAVRTWAGWAQFAVHLTPRLTWNIYAGEQDDTNRDLFFGAIAQNRSAATNLMYKLGSNVVTGFEIFNVRTVYIGSRARSANHYDWSLAYLF